jgi:hypothetical protein
MVERNGVTALEKGCRGTGGVQAGYAGYMRGTGRGTGRGTLACAPSQANHPCNDRRVHRDFNVITRYH